MIEKHGWSVKDWIEQSPEEKAFVIGSLEYWNEQREKEMR